MSAPAQRCGPRPRRCRCAPTRRGRVVRGEGVEQHAVRLGVVDDRRGRRVEAERTPGRDIRPRTNRHSWRPEPTTCGAMPGRSTTASVFGGTSATTTTARPRGATRPTPARRACGACRRVARARAAAAARCGCGGTRAPRARARHRAVQPVGDRPERVVVERGHLAGVHRAVGQQAVPALPHRGRAHVTEVQPRRALGLQQQALGGVEVSGVGERVGDERRADEAGRDAVAALAHELGEAARRARAARGIRHQVEPQRERVGRRRVVHHAAGGRHVLGDERGACARRARRTAPGRRVAEPRRRRRRCASDGRGGRNHEVAVDLRLLRLVGRRVRVEPVAGCIAPRPGPEVGGDASTASTQSRMLG